MHCHVFFLAIAATVALACTDVDLGTTGGRKFYTKQHVSTPDNWKKAKIVKVQADPNEIISRIIIKDLTRAKSGAATILSGGVGLNQVTVKLKGTTAQRKYRFMIEMYALPNESGHRKGDEETAAGHLKRVHNKLSPLRGTGRKTSVGNKKYHEHKNADEAVRLRQYKHISMKPLKGTTTKRSKVENNFKEKIFPNVEKCYSNVRTIPERKDEIPDAMSFIRRRPYPKVKDTGKHLERSHLMKATHRKAQTTKTAIVDDVDYIRFGKEIDKIRSFKYYNLPEETESKAKDYPLQREHELDQAKHEPSPRKPHKPLKYKALYYRRRKIDKLKERLEYIPHKLSKALKFEPNNYFDTAIVHKDQATTPAILRYFKPVRNFTVTRHYGPAKRLTPGKEADGITTAQTQEINSHLNSNSREIAKETAAELTRYMLTNKTAPKEQTIRNLSQLIYQRIRQKLLQGAKEEGNEANPMHSGDEIAMKRKYSDPANRHASIGFELPPTLPAETANYL